MTHLVTLDTETTHLNWRKGHMWELALIVEGHPNPILDGEWLFTFPTVSLKGAEPYALTVGRFYQRIRGFSARAKEDPGYGRAAHIAAPSAEAAAAYLRPSRQGVPPIARKMWFTPATASLVIVGLLDGATVVGCRPEFDKPFIEKYLRKHSPFQWSAHYHTIDVAQVTFGRLGRTTADLPYRSDDLAAELGVEPPTREERHTAMGDARWVRRWLWRLDEHTQEPVWCAS